jgi:hypothetical protein
LVWHHAKPQIYFFFSKSCSCFCFIVASIATIAFQKTNLFIFQFEIFKLLIISNQAHSLVLLELFVIPYVSFHNRSILKKIFYFLAEKLQHFLNIENFNLQAALNSSFACIFILPLAILYYRLFR